MLLLSQKQNKTTLNPTLSTTNYDSTPTSGQINAVKHWGTEQRTITQPTQKEKIYIVQFQHKQNPESQCWDLHSHQQSCVRLTPKDYQD